MKKTCEDLRLIREQVIDDILLRKGLGEHIKIVVGMGEVGYLAGARDVVKAFLHALRNHKLTQATLIQDGTLNDESKAPIVKIQIGNEPWITYTKVTVDEVDHIVQEHMLVKIDSKACQTQVEV